MNISTPMLAIILTVFAMAGGVTVAWSDVKSDIAVVQTVAADNKEKYKDIDAKLDKIIDHLLKEKKEKDDDKG